MEINFNDIIDYDDLNNFVQSSTISTFKRNLVKIKDCVVHFIEQNEINVYFEMNNNKYIIHHKPLNETIILLKNIINKNSEQYNPEMTQIQSDGMFICFYTTNIFHYIYDSLQQYILMDKVKNIIANKTIIYTTSNGLKFDKIFKFMYEINVNNINLGEKIYFKNFYFYLNNFLFTNPYYELTYNILLNNTKAKFIKIYPNVLNLIQNKNIYISRRKTNTTKCNFDRILINEIELINYLKKYNYEEIFLEHYDTFEDKIQILSSSKNIILLSSATRILIPYLINKHNVLFIGGPFKVSCFPFVPDNITQYTYMQTDNYDNKHPNFPNIPWTLNLEKFDKFFNTINMI